MTGPAVRGALTPAFLPLAGGRAGSGRLARGAFTLVELLVVIGIISLLASIMVPSLAAAKSQARKTVCAVNLRHLNQAFMMYLTANDWEYFPYRQELPDLPGKQEGGTLWYWGFEPGGQLQPEGSRRIDVNRARLAPHFEADRHVQVCPEAEQVAAPFKPKFNLAGYGYAINKCMLAGPDAKVRFDRITMASETVAWADSMQINTWQAPASPANPMLEDWYYLQNTRGFATFHFRHRKTCNAAFADASIRPLEAYWLDERCDGLVGGPEPPVPSGQSPILKLDK